MQRAEWLRWAGLILVGMQGIGMIGGVYFVFASKGWLAGTGERPCVPRRLQVHSVSTTAH